MLTGVFNGTDKFGAPLRFATNGDDFVDETIGAYAADLDEPSLDELLADPMIRLLMKRDGVELAALMDIIEQARLRLGA